MIIVENATPEFQNNIDSMCTELALSPKNPLGKSGLGGNFKIYNILRNLNLSILTQLKKCPQFNQKDIKCQIKLWLQSSLMNWLS